MVVGTLIDSFILWQVATTALALHCPFQSIVFEQAWSFANDRFLSLHADASNSEIFRSSGEDMVTAMVSAAISWIRYARSIPSIYQEGGGPFTDSLPKHWEASIELSSNVQGSRPSSLCYVGILADLTMILH